MREETARQFWNRYLRLVSTGSADLPVENPVLAFTVGIKAGEYDAVPDEEYNDILWDYEQLSGIWGRERQRTAGEVLLNALCLTELDPHRCERVAEILAECSTVSSYCSPDGETGPGAPSGPEEDGDWGSPDAESPRAIYDYLCSRVHGQDEAKRAAAMLLYNHMAGRRSTAVFCGPSGCGKSEIWRCLARRHPALIRLVDASRLSADGWRGSFHLRDVFQGVSQADLDARGLIVVLDEADKICCETAMGAGGTDYNALIQNSLLKMLDGDSVEFGAEGKERAFRVDCSKVSVVLLGAFENLLRGKSSGGAIGFGAAPRTVCDYGNTDISYDDLIAAGMRREIAGRINRIVSLRPLSVSDYRAILTGPVLDDLQAGGTYRIVLDDDAADRLSREAASTGLGVRWMRSQVMNAVDELMFNNPDAPLYTVRIPAGPAPAGTPPRAA